MSGIYRVEFEVVCAVGPGLQFYRDEQPNCRPEEVPDEFWSKIHRDTDDPWDQYRQLMKWQVAGDQLVRNVKLLTLQASSSLQWVEVKESKGETK